MVAFIDGLRYVGGKTGVAARWAALLFFLAGVSAPALADLVGWWSFDSSLQDASGQGNDFRLGDSESGSTGLVERRPGRYGNAVRVDGASFLINDSPEFVGSYESFTLGAHVLVESLPASPGYAAVLAGTGLQAGIGYHVDRRFYGFAGGENRFVTTPTARPPGTWRHVVQTYDGASQTTKLYIDGVLAGATASLTPPSLVEIAALRIGRVDNKAFLTGLVDEAFLFDEVLSATQIAALANPVAAPARFWITPSGASPLGLAPGGLELDLNPSPAGPTHHFDVWARPELIAAGFYRQFSDITLNIVSSAPLVDFIDNTVVLHNPALDADDNPATLALGRFSNVHDGVQPPNPLNPDINFRTLTRQEVAAGQADAIKGLAGRNLTLTPGRGPIGFGGECVSGDPHCVVTSEGPAWRVGSFGLQALEAIGTTDIRLQIGSGGMRHAGGVSAETDVVFAVPGVTEPVYNAGPSGDRSAAPKPGDLPELRVTISEELVGDYNTDGRVDAADYTRWRDVQGSTQPLANRSPQLSGAVSSGDFEAWRRNYGRTLSGAAVAVPEPASTLGTLLLSLIGLVAVAPRWFRSAFAAGSRRFGEGGLVTRQSSLRAGWKTDEEATTGLAIAEQPNAPYRRPALTYSWGVLALGLTLAGEARGAWNTSTGEKTGVDIVTETLNPWTGPKIDVQGGELDFIGDAVAVGQANIAGPATVVRVGGDLAFGGVGRSSVQGGARLEVDGALLKTGSGAFWVFNGSSITIGDLAGSSIDAGTLSLNQGSQATLSNVSLTEKLAVVDAGTLVHLHGATSISNGVGVEVAAGASVLSEGPFSIVGSNVFSLQGGSTLHSSGVFTLAGVQNFNVQGGSVFSLADPTVASVQAVTARIDTVTGVTLGSFNLSGYVQVGASTPGSQLHVLGNASSVAVANAAGGTGMNLRNGSVFEVDGDYNLTGHATTFDQMTLREGSELRVGGRWTATGVDFIEVASGGVWTLGDVAGSSIDTLGLTVRANSDLAIGSLNARGGLRMGVDATGSRLQVLGDVVNHHEVSGALIWLTRGAVLDVDGSYSLVGAADKTTEVEIEQGSQVSIGGAFSSADLRQFELLNGSSFSVGGPFSMTGYGTFRVMDGSTFTVADPSLATLETNYLEIGGASTVTLASVDASGSIRLGRYDTGSVLNVLGDVQNTHSQNANTALLLQNASRLEVEGSYFFEGQPPFVNNIDILSDSILDVAGELRVENAARLQVATGATANAASLTFDGTTTLVGGGILQSDAATILPAARLRGSLADFRTTGVLSNQGALSPGAGIGVFTVQGGYVQTAAGSLEAEVGENQSGLIADRLIVTGSASIAGRIDLLLAEGFSPTDGDEWTLFEATAITGQIDGVTFPRPEQIPADLAVEIVSTAMTIGVRFIDQTVGGNIVGTATELDWSDAANWTGASVPSAGSAMTLTGAAGVAQTLSVAPSSRVRVADLDLSGNGEELKLVVGANAAFGSLRGIRLGDNGALDVAGGRVVTGALEIAQGGSATVQNGGVLTVRSQTSKSLSIDSLGSGDASELQVSGSGSTVQAFSSVVVGDLGDGRLLIDSGGVFGANLAGTDAANALTIGVGATSNGDVEVSGAGSILNVRGQMVVGEAGTAALAVTQGGRLTTAGAVIGVTPGSTGSVEVLGIGSIWRNEGSIILGGAQGIAGGAATLRVASGARVETTEQLHLNDGATLDLSDGAGAAVVGTAARGVSPLPIAPGRVTVEPTGDLTGSGTVDGSVFSAGRVAPGNSPGILTITGDYTQDATSLLEIEVGALTPGPGSPNVDAGHDQVRVGGVATLGGRYDFPIINGFVPQVNDEIVFIDTFDPDGGGPLPAGSIAPGTRPTSAFAPGLFDADPDLAFRVIASPNDVRLKFVPKGSVTFTDPNSTTADWFDAAGWSTLAVPTSEDETLVQGNLTGQTQVVEIASTTPAQVQQLRVRDDFSEVTLRVASNASLESTVGDVNIGAFGALELNGGRVVTPSTQAVNLYESGTLSGSGEIGSTLNVGVQPGSSGAMVSPGLSGNSLTIGEFSVAGDYMQGDGGALHVDITGDNTGGNHDTLSIAGDLTLQGLLQVDVAAAGLGDIVVGEGYRIATVYGAVSEQLDRVEVLGRDDIYFRVAVEPVLGPATASSSDSEGLATLQDPVFHEVMVFPTWMGDANQDNRIDALDAEVLAALLISPTLPEVALSDGNVASSNLRDAFDFYTEGAPPGPRIIDVDDIPFFLRQMASFSGGNLAEANAVFASAYEGALLRAAIPEPTGVFLAATVLTIFAAARRRPL